jgi:7,8-dihydropterin-6-yl-methyl-4-(beta-D-ribofuranosyl)aminobenzene 5'-phosphate synthase
VRLSLILHLLLFAASAVGAPAPTPPRVRSLRVQILSTMLADRGIGEWGFAAIVEADGHRILFDTGAHPDTVLRNARDLSVDLSSVEEVILSHNHFDHTGGLVTLRRELSKSNPRAVSRAHVARGIFWERPGATPDESALTVKRAYEALGGSFIEHDAPVEIHPGVWLTGPVTRTYPEHNWSASGEVRSPEGLVEDTIPEDQSLVIDTDRGLVVISGCGHAGIVNTLEYARKTVRDAPIHAAIGGFHLFQASEETLLWTGTKLHELGVENLIGAHCTGIEPVFRLRETAKLDRSHAVVGAVGASFELGSGIHPLDLAR